MKWKRWPPPLKAHLERVFEQAKRGAKANPGTPARDLAVGALLVLALRLTVEKAGRRR
jgi:hypothetical protein